jgi:hypothetical protein
VHWHIPHRYHAHAHAAGKQFSLRSTTEQMPALVIDKNERSEKSKFLWRLPDVNLLRNSVTRPVCEKIAKNLAQPKINT